MNPGHTARKRAVWSGFTLFAIKASEVCKQMGEQTTTVVNDGKKVNPTICLWKTEILLL